MISSMNMEAITGVDKRILYQSIHVNATPLILKKRRSVSSDIWGLENWGISISIKTSEWLCLWYSDIYLGRTWVLIGRQDSHQQSKSLVRKSM